MAIVAACSTMVAVSSLGGARSQSPAMLAIGVFGAVFTAGMTVFWLRRWPTRRQSEVMIVGGTLFIAVWSFAQPTSAVAVLACTATAVTGGYIAFFHNTRLLLFNFAVAVVIAASASWRLAGTTDVATALGAFWLIWFLNLSVPLAIRGMSQALGTYAAWSDADPLTGLLNRRGFAGAVTQLVANAGGADGHLSLVMVDLDDFKRVNDTHGHAAGDRALLAVAELLRHHCPSSAAICRAGGEEFLIAVLSHSEGAGDLATRLCRAIAALPHDVTASIGAGSVPLDGFDIEPRTLIDELVAVADAAMYVAKRNGGNQIRLG
ncbi:GGDEF domain-containing protein [Mycolicibacterium chubuense]|nr:GGDEF domain-containing protein [Mycolicibacterium chubuense]